MLFEDQVLVAPPAMLFRYIGHSAESFFQDPVLRFTSPRFFNDPFELMPVLAPKVTNENLEFLRKHNEIPASISRRNLREQIVGILKHDISHKYGIFCLSEIPDDLLMWAHYARSHEGCVLGFDRDLLLGLRYKGSPSYAGRVVYTKERQHIDYPTVHAKEDNLKILFSKGDHWKYEREWRMAVKIPLEANEKHRDVGCPTGTIRWVIIGARAGEVNKKNAYIKAIRKNKNLAHVRILIAHRDPSDFCLRISDLSGRSPLNWEKEMLHHSERKMRSRAKPWYEEAAAARGAQRYHI